MPIYEYQCPDCGVFEQRYSITDFPRITDCPECAEPAPKIVSAVNVGRSYGAAANHVEFAQATSEQPAVVTSTRSGLQAATSAPHITHNPQHRFLPTP